MESISHKLPVRYIPQSKGVWPSTNHVDELLVRNNPLNLNREREINRVNVKFNALESELEDEVKDEIERILDELSLKNKLTSLNHDYEKGISGVNFQFYNASVPKVEAEVNAENGNAIDETSLKKESSYFSQYYEKGIIHADAKVNFEVVD